MEMAIKGNRDTIGRNFNDINSKNNLVQTVTVQNSSMTPTKNTFFCERCNNFETNSRASLLLHAVHCLSNIKTEKLDVGILKLPATEPADKKNDKLLTELRPALNIEQSSHVFNCSASSAPSIMQSSRKLFECDVCKMKFSNGANMRRHKMRHTGVKPYECRVCQKRFFRKDHLAEHFTTHTKTLPYHCPICSRGFQRQIAMRAHFQNEHVGQHDLIKTCPLCTYRAGSMKSLRIHFFNRHGIDLDNPGTSGTSSLLLALESQASHLAAAASNVGFVPDLSSIAEAVISNTNIQSQQGDSSASSRAIENATPPLHTLTPHLEISTLSINENEVLNGNSAVAKEFNHSNDEDDRHSEKAISLLVHDNSMDCTTAKVMPSRRSSSNDQMINILKSNTYDNHISPSISLIPIKQESLIENRLKESSKSCKEQSPSTGTNCGEFAVNNKTMTSLIKVSPLKSLLREDLKRRICVKANNRTARNIEAMGSSLSTSICNGTLTSTDQGSETSILFNKQFLTCLFCGIEFPDETLYFLHKGCHCESNPWKCNICSEQCNNVYEFNSHLLSKSHQ